MSTVFLGLGSNVDAAANIRAGLSALESEFGACAVSPIYQSRSFGFEGNDFINLVVSIETSLEPLVLKKSLKALEERYGRLRDVAKYSDRTLDIDILLYDDLYLISPVLEIPRAEIYTAAYVLKPLADLAPQLMDPLSSRLFSELWDDFKDKESGIKAITFPLDT